MTKRGAFIVLYGINNLGKTTQAKRLTEKLQGDGISAIQIKYPIYTLTPTGPIIYEYLRGGNPYKLSATEAQILYAMNKTHYAPTLEETLAKGITVVAEDYTGTSIAWGAGAGADPNFIETINTHLREPDIALLLDGNRFSEGKEKGHAHEENDELTKRVRAEHLSLAKKYGWSIIQANQSRDDVAKTIYTEVTNRLT